MIKNISKSFLLILVGLVIVASYFVFRPFLTEIFIAAILASIFYTPYLKLTKFLKGRRNIAALLMCLLLVVIIIIPTVRIIIYGGQQSVEAYSQAVNFFNRHSVDGVLQSSALPDKLFGVIEVSHFFDDQSLQDIFLGVLKKSSNWLISGAASLLKGTTNFIISLLLIIITMFFFFVDGKKMLERLMYLSPLPNAYDEKSFRSLEVLVM